MRKRPTRMAWHRQEARRLGSGLAAMVLLLCFDASVAWSSSATQEQLIDALFGDTPNSGGLDANSDGVLSAADIVLLPAAPPFTPTPTRSSKPTISTATPTDTRSIPTPTVTLTRTSSATATATPTNTLVPTSTATFTPVGLLYDGTISDLTPHDVGDVLVYRVTDPMGNVTTEMTTIPSNDPSSGAFVLDDLQMDGQQVVAHEMQSYTDTGNQLFFNGYTDLLANVRTTCSPPLLRLMSPLIANQTFTTTIRCDVKFADSGVPIGFVNRTDTFTPIEIVASVSVPAGTYTNVIHLSGSTNQGGEMETDEFYIAPGVGPVLQLQTFTGQTTRHELVDATIGGTSRKR